MKESSYKSYDDLPLFLNSETVAKVLGVSPSSGYELMHEPGFPVLRIGNRMVVPKEQFIQDGGIQQFCAWMKSGDHMGGGSIADSQIRNCFSLCHRALEKARTEHLISRDPTDGFKLPPVRCEEMKILS